MPKNKNKNPNNTGNPSEAQKTQQTTPENNNPNLVTLCFAIVVALGFAIVVALGFIFVVKRMDSMVERMDSMAERFDSRLKVIGADVRTLVYPEDRITTARRSVIHYTAFYKGKPNYDATGGFVKNLGISPYEVWSYTVMTNTHVLWPLSSASWKIVIYVVDGNDLMGPKKKLFTVYRKTSNSTSGQIAHVFMNRVRVAAIKFERLMKEEGQPKCKQHSKILETLLNIVSHHTVKDLRDMKYNVLRELKNCEVVLSAYEKIVAELKDVVPSTPLSDSHGDIAAIEIPMNLVSVVAGQPSTEDTPTDAIINNHQVSFMPSTQDSPKLGQRVWGTALRPFQLGMTHGELAYATVDSTIRGVNYDGSLRGDAQGAPGFSGTVLMTASGRATALHQGTRTFPHSMTGNATEADEDTKDDVARNPSTAMAPFNWIGENPSLIEKIEVTIKINKK